MPVYIQKCTFAGFFILALAGLATASATDITPADQLTMEVHRVVDADAGANAQVATDTGCAVAQPPFNIGPGEILTIGQKIWQIIEAGKPVVTLTTPMVAALPKGLTCWQNMENWQAPMTQTYEVTYKNLYDMTVVDFKYRLQYSYGGDLNGHGKYLANVTIIPSDLDVDWGYDFDASVKVGDAINVGTDADPVAGLDLTLQWTVKTVMKENDMSVHFFVQGDGTVKAD